MTNSLNEVETEAAKLNRFAEFLFGAKPPPEKIDAKEAARRRLDAARRVVQGHRVAHRNGFVVPETDRDRARAEVRAAEAHAMTLGLDCSVTADSVDIVALRALVHDPRSCIPGSSAIPIDRLILNALLNRIESLMERASQAAIDPGSEEAGS